MPEADARWEEFLDRIEADVALAAAGLDDPSIPVHVELWIPPADLGPMPESLQERALTVLAAQQNIRERLQGARASAARQLGALKSVPESAGTGRSVYLDVTG